MDETMWVRTDVVPVVHGKPTSRENLIAALEACAKGTCVSCPVKDVSAGICREVRAEAAENIRRLSEETDTLRAQIDNYRKEYLRQKMEAEYQTRRADLLHARLQRVYDLLFDMYVRTDLKEQPKEDKDNG